jgi:hypothetical protein
MIYQNYLRLSFLLLLSLFCGIQVGLVFPGVPQGSQNGLEETSFMFFDYFSDSTDYFNIIYREEQGFLAIDSSGNTLFTIYPFDNGPDYPSEGLFRIINNAKIGYANLKGKIVILPQFSAALPFHGGLAAFCENCILVSYGEHKAWEQGKWGFINTNGEIVIPAKYDKVVEDFSEGIARVEIEGKQIIIDKRGNQIQRDKMNNIQWIKILGEVTNLINKVVFENQLTIASNWIQKEPSFTFTSTDASALKIDINSNDSNKFLLSYLIIPWQNFSGNNQKKNQIQPEGCDKFLTVSDFAVIYTSFLTGKSDSGGNSIREQYHDVFKKVINFQDNQQEVETNQFNIPENIQLISATIFPHYLDIQIAIPGSRLPEYSKWSEVSATRKRLFLEITYVYRKRDFRDYQK